MHIPGDLFDKLLADLQRQDGKLWQRIRGEVHSQYNEIPLWVLVAAPAQLIPAILFLRQALAPIRGAYDESVSISFRMKDDTQEYFYGLFDKDALWDDGILAAVDRDPLIEPRRLDIFDFGTRGRPTTIASRTVYQNRWMRVREDDIRWPDGRTGIYGVVEKPDFCVIAAVENGAMHLVNQFRYPIGKPQWEMPQGALEDRPDADPAEIAATELRQETGLRAASITKVGFLYEAYGYATQGCHIFLATDLTQGAPEREPSEHDMSAYAFPIAEIERLILENIIQDGITVAAFGLLRMRGLI